MSLQSLFGGLQDTALAHLVSKSNHLVGAGLQVVHIFGFVLLLAALVLVCLRLLGWVLSEQPLPRVVGAARRLFRVGMVLAIVSGTLIFIATARLYLSNWAFGLKLALFAAALVAQITLLRPILKHEQPPKARARLAVLVSVVLWFGIGFAGRLIAFV